MKRLAAPLVAAGLLLTAARISPAVADAAPGLTMHIQREYLIGGDAASDDFRATFLPPDRFRIQGIQRLKQMQSDVQISLASDGRIVRHIEKVGDKTTAHTVDLDRIRKELLTKGVELEDTPRGTRWKRVGHG